MADSSFHVDPKHLSPLTIMKHHAILSVMEELNAVDWYRQRAEDCMRLLPSPEKKERAAAQELAQVLKHNAREEIEHAAMCLEWLRRNDKDFDEKLKEYLFTDKPIIQVEHDVEHPDVPATSTKP